MICRCDASGRYLFANRAYVARFDRSPESVIGLHLSHVIGPAAYETIAPLVARVLAGERGESAIEVPYPTGRRLMRCAYEPEFDDRQRVTSFVVALTDETARLNAEEALRLSREHLDFIVEADDAREMAQGGLGIGLTLVRQLVTMHQGEVVARSDGRGRGSEFRVTLPVVNGSCGGTHA